MTTAAATATTPLATIDQLRAYVGPINAEALDDGQATFALAAASAAVRNYCQWQLTAVAADSFEVDTGDSGGPVLALQTLALGPVASVTVDGWSEPVTDFVPFRVGYLRRARGWPANRRIVVIADHGYDQVPGEVAGVTCSIASRTLVTAGMGPVSQTRVDGVQALYGRNDDVTDTAVLMLSGEQAMLDSYRIPSAS